MYPLNQTQQDEREKKEWLDAQSIVSMPDCTAQGCGNFLDDPDNDPEDYLLFVLRSHEYTENQINLKAIQ